MESLLVPSSASLALPGTRALVLAPHPDDEVFGCGGAIMRHVAAGQPVHVIICTNGAWGQSADARADYIAQRRNESIAAARILGYGTPEFWGYEDRGLRYDEKLVQELIEAITAAGADLVYAPCLLEMHPDHRVLAMAAVEAVRRSGEGLRIAQYEVGVPLRPNLLLDITDLAARKLEAMQCFTSQLTRQRYDLDVAALNRFRSFTLPAGVTAAEAYSVASGAELTQDPLGLYQSEHARQHALGLPLDIGDMPLVSVIVRSMDRPSLVNTLDSIALQTYPNIEVVLVNAKGSAHRALEPWCGRFPLRVIDAGKPLERATACNTGLDAARGDLLIFLDDDDLFLPHHINRLHAELDHDPDAVAAYAAVLATDTAGKEIQRFAEEFDPLKLTVGNFIPIHSLLFRRAAVRNGARFDESLPVCEDWDFWLQLQAQGHFRFVRETGAIYRMRADSGSRVWVDEELSHRVMLQVYRKRVASWSDRILWGIFEWARYKPRYDELVATHERVKQDAAAAEARVQQVLQQQEQERADFDARAASLRAELAGAMSQYEARIATLNTRQDQLTYTLREREDRIAAIYASTSWRITRPLRGLVTLLRGRASTPAAVAPVATQAKAAVAPRTEPAHQPQAAQPVSTSQLAGQGVRNYDYEEDINGPNAAAFVCQLTGKGKRVLEIGTGPGSITKLLKRYGDCRVTGIELEEASIARVREFCEVIHQADLNSDDWPQVLGDATGFDTVVAADVLEHLYDPWKTLRQMAKLVGADGSIVVSLPHAGHAAIAGCLFNGDVAYRHSGLLDRTHIRFFGLRNVEELFAQAGLKIVDARYVIKAPEETELHEHWQRLPDPVKSALKLSKHFDIYQVVVRAVPLDRPGAAVALI